MRQPPLSLCSRCLALNHPANPDYRDIFSIFNTARVEYLLVGAHAVMYYAEPRYTKDLEIWVNPTPANATRVVSALREFGAPLRNVSEKDFQDPDMVYQIGVEPNRIDILMGISGVDFESAWAEKTMTTYDGVPVPVLGLRSLKQAKAASARDQDLLDIKRLRGIDPEDVR